MTYPVVNSTARALIVDDNVDAADTLAALLSRFGCEVAVAYSGAEGLARGAALRPHLVLLDVGMPDMHGCETSRRMRSLPWGQDAIIVALTPWSDEPTRQQVELAGMDHHLVKSGPVIDLLDIVTALKG